MSDTTRIGGYGGYTGLPHQRQRSASLARFRKRRSPGDIVSGVFVRHESADTGWAHLEGEELLAMLPPEGPRPELGSTVYFYVESLFPEVVLRMLPASDPGIALFLAAGSRPLSRQAAHYASARDKLDALLGPGGWRDVAASAPLPVRKDLFAAFVASRPEAFAAYAESVLHGRMLLRAARSTGLVFFRHMPWLAPALHGVEVAFGEANGLSVLAGARLGDGSAVRVQGWFDKGMFRYRVVFSGDMPETSHPVEEVGGTSAVCLGCSGKTAVADVVGEILSSLSGAVGNQRYSRKL